MLLTFPAWPLSYNWYYWEGKNNIVTLNWRIVDHDDNIFHSTFFLFRRSNMHFSSSGGLSPSSREGIDPITELLSQLSSVRRSGGGSNSSAPSQLQQLQMQLQLERQHGRVRSFLYFCFCH